MTAASIHSPSSLGETVLRQEDLQRAVKVCGKVLTLDVHLYSTNMLTCKIELSEPSCSWDSGLDKPSVIGEIPGISSIKGFNL